MTITTNQNWAEGFEAGIDFAMNLINEQCGFQFESLESVVAEIDRLREIKKVKPTVTSDDLDFEIRTRNDERIIRVNPMDDEVWFNLTVPGSVTYTTLTVDEAQQLIDALNALVEHTKAA
jgi:hypothetical protein